MTVNKKYDAIIIGAGVIGTPIAYELSKMGYKTLTLDKQPDAGEGSTAGSCAIVRAHYSTEDGVALAYEGFNGRTGKTTWVMSRMKKAWPNS